MHLDFESSAFSLAKGNNKSVPVSLRAGMVSEIQNLGLSKKYKDPESDIGKCLKIFFGLSY